MKQCCEAFDRLERWAKEHENVMGVIVTAGSFLALGLIVGAAKTRRISHTVIHHYI